MVRRAALLLALILLPMAHGQSLSGAAEATLAAPSQLAGNGTVVRTVDVTLTVSGLICTQDTDFTVPLRLDRDNTSIVAVLEPDVMTFTVPAGTTLLSAYQDTRQATLVATDPGVVAMVSLTVTAGEPTGSCLGTGAIARSGDTATTTVAWAPSMDAAPDDAPEQIMPLGPAWAGVLGALVLARRRSPYNGPK